MTFTVGEILLILAGIGLVLLFTQGMTILDALTKFTDWTGKKWKEQEEKNRQRQRGGGREP